MRTKIVRKIKTPNKNLSEEELLEQEKEYQQRCYEGFINTLTSIVRKYGKIILERHKEDEEK